MLWSAVVLGLLGSFHCFGMCGPIAFMLPVDRENETKKIVQISLYHFGRLMAYGLIGLVFGLVGKSLYIFGLQQQLSILIGVIMVMIILIPSFFKFNKLSRPIFQIISRLKSSMGKSFKRKSPDTFLTIGFLNGFLPCGLVYIAVFASIAIQNTINSALYMIFFGIGTIPLMTSIIYVGKFIKPAIKQKIQKAIPIFVVFLGILFIVRGMGLGIPYISPTPVVDITSNSMDCHP
ncbi:MAG: sulfite exporter TauE/SafE family protein [Bacteroidota bacterium]